MEVAADAPLKRLAEQRFLGVLPVTLRVAVTPGGHALLVYALTHAHQLVPAALKKTVPNLRVSS